jgi:hypothetical protein
MNQAPYLLDRDSRAAVLEAEVRPEKVMKDFKSYASRGLNRLGRDGSDRKRWARHGSTRWLWKDREVQDAIRYVVADVVRAPQHPLPYGRGSAELHFCVAHPCGPVVPKVATRRDLHDRE